MEAYSMMIMISASCSRILRKLHVTTRRVAKRLVSEFEPIFLNMGCSRFRAVRPFLVFFLDYTLWNDSLQLGLPFIAVLG